MYIEYSRTIGPPILSDNKNFSLDKFAFRIIMLIRVELWRTMGVNDILQCLNFHFAIVLKLNQLF